MLYGNPAEISGSTQYSVVARHSNGEYVKTTLFSPVPGSEANTDAALLAVADALTNAGFTVTENQKRYYVAETA